VCMYACMHACSYGRTYIRTCKGAERVHFLSESQGFPERVVHDMAPTGGFYWGERGADFGSSTAALCGWVAPTCAGRVARARGKHPGKASEFLKVAPVGNGRLGRSKSSQTLFKHRDFIKENGNDRFPAFTRVPKEGIRCEIFPACSLKLPLYLLSCNCAANNPACVRVRIWCIKSPPTHG